MSETNPGAADAVAGAASRVDAPSILDPRSSIPVLPPEDRARADFYALLARLYADVPDRSLLTAIAAAPTIEGQTPFATSWNRLIAASSAMDAEAAAQEYTDLFLGVGKSEVNLHASHWVTGAMMDKPLVNLRSDLAKLGLERRDDAAMVEDHLSALCETMRLLVAGDSDRPPAPIAAQRAFFDRHIAPWVFLCCAAIRDCAIANYYVRVAEFTEQHMALDRDALAMD